MFVDSDIFKDIMPAPLTRLLICVVGVKMVLVQAKKLEQKI